MRISQNSFKAIKNRLKISINTLDQNLNYVLKKVPKISLKAPSKSLSKPKWRTIGNKKKFFRSKWEANYARYLEYLKSQNFIKEWLHEPKTFWFEKIKRGVRSYLPDFKIINTDNTHYWVEVKGYMDDKSKTKIKRFAKYFKEEKLMLIDKKWFRKNSKKMKLICEGWE